MKNTTNVRRYQEEGVVCRYSADGHAASRIVPKLRQRSRSLSLVETKEPAEPFPTLDSADFSIPGTRSVDETVAQPLMIPFEMIVARVLSHHSPKMRLAERDDLREAL